jgi:prepilin-type N-terminal cleavage/methylation domain-containing protein
MNVYGRNLSRRGFTLIELLIVISILVILSVAVAMNFIGFDYDARHSSTKSNLASTRSAINLFRSRHSAFPAPTVSGASKATQAGEKTLEAILSNAAGHGDGTEYIRGNIAGELISAPGGNAFVCVVRTPAEFYADQSNGDGCQNTSADETFQPGGYVYCPVNGALRLNFQVNGDDLRTEDQLPIDALSADWVTWAEQKAGLENDWPVTW